MIRTLRISLGTPVGRLWGDAEQTHFQFDDSYLTLPRRPVLGQHFEDRLEAMARRHRGLHPWFQNVLPEPGSAVRDRLVRDLDLGPGDDIGLLCALGRDLPGATVAYEDEHAPSDARSLDEPEPSADDAYRTSLGGMQLKFSLSGTPNRLTLTARDSSDEAWILKIGAPTYPDLAENEASIMRWCAASGFDVPEVRVLPREAFPELGALPNVPSGYLIRRYDRDHGKRIHQEDFLQVLGAPPHRKYDRCDAIGLARAVHQVLGEPGLVEFLRRLVAVVATGNADAHLKNWSLLYPDGITPQWSPLYDQVSTVAYPAISTRFALRIGRAAHFADIGMEHFGWLIEQVAGPDLSRRLLPEVDATAAQMGSAFEPEAFQTPPTVVEPLRAHWRTAPLLRRHTLGR